MYSITVGFSPTYTVDPMLPSGNPIKCHEEVLSSQPMIPPKHFDIFSPLTGGCSEGLDAFRYLLSCIYGHRVLLPLLSKLQIQAEYGDEQADPGRDR